MLSLGAAGIDGLSIVPGHLLYAREGVVVAQPFDEQTLTPRGAPLTLAHTDPAAAWQPQPSASRTGIVVFRSKWYTTRQLAWRGRDGTPMGVIGNPDVYTAVDLSPTGTRAVLDGAVPDGSRIETSGLPISRVVCLRGSRAIQDSNPARRGPRTGTASPITRLKPA